MAGAIVVIAVSVAAAVSARQTAVDDVTLEWHHVGAVLEQEAADSLHEDLV